MPFSEVSCLNLLQTPRIVSEFGSLSRFAFRQNFLVHKFCAQFRRNLIEKDETCWSLSPTLTSEQPHQTLAENPLDFAEAFLLLTLKPTSSAQ